MNIEVDNLSVMSLLDIYKAISCSTDVDPDFENYVLDRMPKTLDISMHYNKENFLALYGEGYPFDEVVEIIFNETESKECTNIQ